DRHALSLPFIFVIMAEAKTLTETPLMKQYNAIKAKYPGALLLFRVGDFYETFGEDAIRTAEALGIILTHRNNGGNNIELAGFPYHAMDMYLPKLVQAGYRVAICEQLEKPSKEKKIVDRGVIELITPGIATEDSLLERKHNNYLASIHFISSDHFGVAFLDVSTGEFVVNEASQREIEKLLQSFSPSEILFARSNKDRFEKYFGASFYTFSLEDWVFTTDYTNEKILRHFEIATLKGFGIDHLFHAQVAAGSILHYLASTKQDGLKHIRTINRIQSEHYVWMDRFTIRNLELLQPTHETGTSLLDILDRTSSPMGARMLRKWIALPLINLKEIRSRHDMVTYAIENSDWASDLKDHVRLIGDLERIISKVSLSKVNPREMIQLRRALSALQPIKEWMHDSRQESMMRMADQINICDHLRQTIELGIQEDAPSVLIKGNVIRKGYNEELDEYRDIIQNSKEILVSIQQEEAIKTGITNLKVGYNNVFGYFLEVTNKYKNLGLIPGNWVRKQTLSNCERYVTDDLKKLEQKILGAEEKIGALEESLFNDLVSIAQEYIGPIQINATVIAQLDCILSLATVAQTNNYCRPEMNDGLSIEITDGRHPVIERHLPAGETYVANSLFLDSDEQQIYIITGPNMSGKSALLRQTALICLMAQMGSFIPAKAATLGVIDKLFTRVGASDNISSGESTFMVEMNETASILNNISPRSLILMDEIGRGTSTFDGISLAWSIAEYLHHHAQCKPKTLFATHYHELNELAERYERIHNYHIATQETGNKVIFLRKLMPGGSEHSFGIHVARMAGMPRTLLERATEILHELESKNLTLDETSMKSKVKELKEHTSVQLSIFDQTDVNMMKLKDELGKMNVNQMTPIECMLALVNLKKILDD
ncbi:MAG TPA: DNA mismatch repair protein MutS, partial [Saprospiraceae bacterium]|nr:DNA mismatch repair protein MutS [Saprospiraceae bacterium]